MGNVLPNVPEITVPEFQSPYWTLDPTGQYPTAASIKSNPTGWLISLAPFPIVLLVLLVIFVVGYSSAACVRCCARCCQSCCDCCLRPPKWTEDRSLCFLGGLPVTLFLGLLTAIGVLVYSNYLANDINALDSSVDQVQNYQNELISDNVQALEMLASTNASINQLLDVIQQTPGADPNDEQGVLQAQSQINQAQSSLANINGTLNTNLYLSTAQSYSDTSRTDIIGVSAGLFVAYLVFLIPACVLTMYHSVDHEPGPTTTDAESKPLRPRRHQHHHHDHRRHHHHHHHRHHESSPPPPQVIPGFVPLPSAVDNCNQAAAALSAFLNFLLAVGGVALIAAAFAANDGCRVGLDNMLDQFVNSSTIDYFVSSIPPPPNTTSPLDPMFNQTVAALDQALSELDTTETDARQHNLTAVSAAVANVASNVTAMRLFVNEGPRQLITRDNVYPIISGLTSTLCAPLRSDLLMLGIFLYITFYIMALPFIVIRNRPERHHHHKDDDDATDHQYSSISMDDEAEEEEYAE